MCAQTGFSLAEDRCDQKKTQNGLYWLNYAERQTKFSKKDSDIVMIPMVEARLSGGSGSLETSAANGRDYAFRRDFILRRGNPNDMVLMRVSGDSMEPDVCDNDVVLIDQSKKDILPGRMYAVGFEEAIYLKRIDIVPGKAILKVLILHIRQWSWTYADS